jgi:DNA-binding NtrC family response regulator
VALILVVDDEPAVRTILARWIRRAGHEIVEAECAADALHVMERQPAAVVFTDIQMPGHDGLWLTAELRKRYLHTAVVLATSVATVAPNVSMQAGVLAYLVKPFNADAVKKALETAIAWHADTVRHGPREEDAADRLQAWLDSLESL